MEDSSKIWIVDDERIVRISLADDLCDAGYKVREFADGNSVLAELSESIPDIVITDLKMPGIEGIDLLARLKELHPGIIVIVMTAYGTVENAVKAMKIGAFDYITKPFNTEEIKLTIERALEFSSIKEENKNLRKQIGIRYNISSYIGDAETNEELFRLIELVAKKDSTVLITGETGTGKELVTNIIHYNSNRKDKPLIKVSCAILSKDIFESELFGHVKGAYTGADSDKQGRLELANNGTLYLDDIDDIPLDLQVKLLRALEEGEIEKVGSAKTIPINVRVITSTKKDLLQLVKEGKFREDLYYRLNIFPINIPSLRERKKDIKVILQYYLEKFSGKDLFNVSPDALKKLLDYHWPGNVRELKNMAERLIILSNDSYIELAHIPAEFRHSVNFDVCSTVGAKPLEQLLADVEIASILCALERTKYHKSKAAKLLGIPPSTLRTKMDKHSIV
jgi:DNA-binding NtrC family response regulator